MISPVMPIINKSGDSRLAPVHQAARELEAAFLSEMLQSAGVGRMPGSFNGGAGEDQFQSLLTDAKARALVAAGGLGLADKLAARLASRGAEVQP